jgi:hypothetical protein
VDLEQLLGGEAETPKLPENETLGVVMELGCGEEEERAKGGQPEGDGRDVADWTASRLAFSR